MANMLVKNGASADKYLAAAGAEAGCSWAGELVED